MVRFTRRSAPWVTVLAGVDPGLTRLRSAAVAVASMVLAVATTTAVRATIGPAAPMTMVLFAGAMAMFANIAVLEREPGRRRATTALLLVPATVSTVLGALLTPHRLLADAAFVVIAAATVWVRRFGPRADALGMGALIPFFATVFFKAELSQLPWLLLAVVVAVISTVLLRCVVFAEVPAVTLRRTLVAFRARGHGLALAVDAVLAALVRPGGERAHVDRRALDRIRLARHRLGTTALLVADQLDRRPVPDANDDALALRVFDTELALERLTVATWRLVTPAGPTVDRTGRGRLAALREGLDRLLPALDPATPTDTVRAAAANARAAITEAEVTDADPSVQRAAAALRQVADAVDRPRAVPAPTPRSGAEDGPPEDGTGEDGTGEDGAPSPGPPNDPDPRGHGPLRLSTRQAIQVGVGAILALVAGEIIAGQRWYLAVITAFIVFTGTQSRGELLVRGWARVLGTVGGVLAGAGLATLAGDHTTVALILLFGCAFLALYLARISPVMLAFWFGALLSLLLGILGQLGPDAVTLRIQETAVGVIAAAVAAFLVLPKGTRDAAGDALHTVLDAMDTVLDVACTRLTAATPNTPPPYTQARDMHRALALLRERLDPLAGPIPLRRTRYARALWALVLCDHYLRALTRLSGEIHDPAWAGALDPAVVRIRAGLAGLGTLLTADRRLRVPSGIASGEIMQPPTAELLAAAETRLSPSGDAGRAVVRVLRGIDEAVTTLAVDLDAAPGSRPTAQRAAASS